MKILAIESSCDESAAAVVGLKNDHPKIYSSIVSSQIPIHKPYSGVVPELASRAHVININDVIERAVKEVGGHNNINGIAVTTGPGLAGSLLVGRMAAETLSMVWNKPVMGINHIEGHLLSPLLINQKIRPPFIGLVVSGGHTEIILAKKWGEYSLLGRTRDDAAGEAFDKVAKMLDLGYPGGPAIQKLAAKGDRNKTPFPFAWLPGTWDFSFSGLKTAVLYHLKEKKRLTKNDKINICAGFQYSVVRVLAEKSVAACRMMKIPRLVVGGGVAANAELRNTLKNLCGKNNIGLFIAPPHLCTDNAAMIGCAALFRIKNFKSSKTNLSIDSNWHLPFTRQSIPKFTLPLLSSN